MIFGLQSIYSYWVFDLWVMKTQLSVCEFNFTIYSGECIGDIVPNIGEYLSIRVNDNIMGEYYDANYIVSENGIILLLTIWILKSH